MCWMARRVWATRPCLEALAARQEVGWLMDVGDKNGSG